MPLFLYTRSSCCAFVRGQNECRCAMAKRMRLQFNGLRRCFCSRCSVLRSDCLCITRSRSSNRRFRSYGCSSVPFVPELYNIIEREMEIIVAGTFSFTISHSCHCFFPAIFFFSLSSGCCLHLYPPSALSLSRSTFLVVETNETK